MISAVSDMETAYNDAAGRDTSDTSKINVGAGLIASYTLTPGVYTWNVDIYFAKSFYLSGGACDVFIFQTSKNLIAGSAARVILQGGVQASNVYWQVAGNVEIGTTAHIEGIILCKTDVTFKTLSTLNGRILCQTFAALQMVTIVETTLVTPAVEPTSAPTATPTSTPTNLPTNHPTMEPTEMPTTGAQTPAPTSMPTTKPTSALTSTPTELPTQELTPAPTFSPKKIAELVFSVCKSLTADGVDNLKLSTQSTVADLTGISAESIVVSEKSCSSAGRRLLQSSIIGLDIEMVASEAAYQEVALSVVDYQIVNSAISTAIEADTGTTSAMTITATDAATNTVTVTDDNDTDPTDTIATDIDTITTDVDTIITDVDTASTDVDTTSTDVDTAATDIDTTTVDVDTATTDVDIVATDVDTATTDVDTVTTDVDTVATDVDAATTDVDTATTDIDTTTTDTGTTTTDTITEKPTSSATKQPTSMPTKQPTFLPTKDGDTFAPTQVPTQQPTSVPTSQPTKEPTTPTSFAFAGCDGGTGSFSVAMSTSGEPGVKIGTIPEHQEGLLVHLTATTDADLDLRIYDASDTSLYDEGTAIVAWCSGLCNVGAIGGDSAMSVTSGTYAGMDITYSGVNGVFSQI
jgi:outer membrane murein-binding lipoprotein Lpp